MTPRMVNALLDPILAMDDIGWDQIDVLNDLYNLYPQFLESYLLRSNGDNGKALIGYLVRYVDELRLSLRPDNIRIASLNRIILNLKGMVNF